MTRGPRRFQNRNSTSTCGGTCLTGIPLTQTCGCSFEQSHAWPSTLTQSESMTRHPERDGPRLRTASGYASRNPSERLHLEHAVRDRLAAQRDHDDHGRGGGGPW